MTKYESNIELQELLSQIRRCEVCREYLPLGPNPVLRAGIGAKILIVGQAPGTAVHRSGIPWNDPSGDTIRTWMGIGKELFYDENRIAIISMGFCYPGKGKSGDLPPRKECAPLWHEPLFRLLPNLQLTILAGSYAIRYYIPGAGSTGIQETIRNYRQHSDRGIFPLVHPSPRNRLWLKKNPWFEAEVIPSLKTEVARILAFG